MREWQRIRLASAGCRARRLIAERSRGEPGPVEPGDEAGLAQVLLAQGREAPFELTGLTVAPRQFPQVRQQGDGLVVPRGHLGADQLPRLGPGGLRVLGQLVQAPLPGCFALVFPQGLSGSGLASACR